MKLAEVPRRKITIALAILGIGLFIALLIGFLGTRAPSAPVVTSLEPADGQENFLGETPITVTFQENLGAKQQDLIYFEFKPEAFFTIRWVSDKQVEATLLAPLSLELNTTYSIKVLYNNKPIYTSSFKTPNLTKEELTRDLTEQAEGDRLFADAQTDWYKDNPWYSQLPIVKDDYTIVYESDTSKFRIRLTLGDNPTGAEIESAKNRALEDLKTAGVNLDKYEHYFIDTYE